jgi:hypothetical protein
VEVRGLAQDSSCHPFEFNGIVVKRSFGNDGLTLTGIVIEQSDGTRSFINVDPVSAYLGMALKYSLIQATQLLTRTGRKVKGRALACGAAGRVLMLDSIK